MKNKFSKSEELISRSKSLRNSPTISMLTSPRKKERNAVTKTMIPYRDTESNHLLSHSKLLGLEAIGVFSEFVHIKQLFNHVSPENSERKGKTIYITDFMKKEQKRKLLMDVGGWDAYLLRKNEFQKDSISRDVCVKNFFQPSEKLPKFFNTPQNSPRTHKIELRESIESFDKKKTKSKIDYLIKQCDIALSMKKVHSPSSINQVNSQSKLKRINLF